MDPKARPDNEADQLHRELMEEGAEEELQPEQPPSALATLALSHAPWWVISALFHGLMILLLSLITWAIKGPELTEDILVVTTLEKAPEVPLEREVKSNLSGTRDVDATDPDSTVPSDIQVPPEILAKAELGDHFETINPDRPDTQSAFGNPEAHMFHSVSGNDEPAGGGGSGGITFDEVIGIGGSGSPGTGGGWGGGDGTGIGTDKGPGRGSFGQRNGGGRRLMVMRHGGSRASESAVDRALRWLAAHQEPDGHWDTQKYGSQHKVDTAATGFALLAFLGAGHTERVGQYKDNVKRAVAWLISKQAPDGLVFDSTDAGAHRGIGYPHAISGMALAEAGGMGRVPTTVEAAQKAISWSCKGSYEGGEAPWRYKGATDPNSADLSVSGWYVMQLKSAKVSGLDVPKGSFEKAIKFVDAVEVKVGKDEGYGVASEYKYRIEQPWPNGKYRVSCIGTLCRQFLGWKKEELEASVRHFVELGGVPAWAGDGGQVDLYYWYYATLCTFQQGGEIWKKWNEAMKAAFIPSQRKGGDEDGSWDPVGYYSSEWGRVGQTALACLCLEVYYRYLPMYR